jgi:electron transport complex protein RnfC
MDFHGGLKLPLNHELTIDKPLIAARQPGKVCVLLSQHSGSPAVAAVEPGSRVGLFEVIARAIGAVSCDVHSPVAGVVEKIDEFVHPYYKYCQGIVIAADREAESGQPLSFNEAESFTIEEITEASKKFSIIDTVSNNKPLHSKISGLSKDSLHYLVISFVQNEPYIHNIETISHIYLEEILSCVSYINGAFNPAFVFFALPYHMVKLITSIDNKLNQDKSRYKNFKIIRVTDKYPQANEIILASSILRTKIKSADITSGNKCLILDAATVFHLYEALKFNKPQIECHLTVSGYGITKPANIKARVGTHVSDIIEQCGGFCGNVNSLIIDGLMSGYSQFTLDVPLIKSNRSITVIPTERLSSAGEQKCMRCKKCVDGCPVGLDPARLNFLSRSGAHEQAADEGIYSCIECGVCSYICPSRINITHSIILSKKMILEANVRRRKDNESV